MFVLVPPLQKGGGDQKPSKRGSRQTSGPVGTTHQYTLVQQQSVTSGRRCHSRGLQGRLLLTLGRNHGGENFNILIAAAVDLMHGLSLLPCRVSGSRWPLSGALVADFPKPVWVWDHCAGPQKAGCLSRQSPPQHFLIPSVFFFFLNESYYCKPLIEHEGFRLPPARMYLTFLFCSVCCSEFGSLL